jgi:hypothetical protein
VAEHEPEEVTPEQLLEAIRRMKVTDLLLSTIATVGQLGYAKLDPDSRDLEQARLAIDALKALVPVLEGAVPPEALRDFNQMTANLQLAYASAAAETREPEAPKEEPTQEAPPEDSTGDAPKDEGGQEAPPEDSAGGS